MRAAAEVYEALGISDRIGFSQDQSANTSVAKDAYNTDLGPWVTWSTPELE